MWMELALLGQVGAAQETRVEAAHPTDAVGGDCPGMATVGHASVGVGLLRCSAVAAQAQAALSWERSGMGWAAQVVPEAHALARAWAALEACLVAWLAERVVACPPCSAEFKAVTMAVVRAAVRRW